jgi:hypothetical protein
MWPTPTADTKSLGWALVDLIESELRVPTGPKAGQPMQLTNEQMDLVVAWYEVDGRGEFIYRRGAWRLPKKWSKSPLAAAIAYCEFVGPVVFSHWGEDGEPVGKPHPAPWVQIAACSEDQTDNTFGQLVAMLSDSPAVAERGLDVGVTRIKFVGGPDTIKIEPVTSAAASREGQPITFAILDETHLWHKTNGGKKLAATIRRNAAPLGARTLETTNAFAPGEGSVAESTHEAVMSGRVRGVFYVAREAPFVDVTVRDDIDRKALRAALVHVYGDSARENGGWTDIDRLVEEFFDTANDLSELCRFYLNQIVAPSEAIVDLTVFAQLASADARLTQGDTIALGFDGSDVGDCTALYACRWPDYLLVPLGVWERPDGAKAGEWKVPRDEVGAAVRHACETYNVVRGYFDPPQWQTEIDGWSGEFGKSVMRFPHQSDQRIGPAAERFASMVEERTLRHTGDPVLVRHLANGRRGQAGRWWRPARQHQGRPIDAASAAIGAVHALGDAVAHGEVVAPAEFFVY